MPHTALFAWIGDADLAAPQGGSKDGEGAIHRAIVARRFERVVLLCDRPRDEGQKYEKWLKSQLPDITVDLHVVKLSSPVDYSEVYRATEKVVEDFRREHGDAYAMTFHASPGTPAMKFAWLFLERTRYEGQAEVIDSSRKHGVRTVELPFAVSVRHLPSLLREADKRAAQIAQGLAPPGAAFRDIIGQCPAMRVVLADAERVAAHNVPVLILGPSGTGKELFAKAIAQASPRKNQPFVPVNCGAIPATLIESELFGYEKGSHSAAAGGHKGIFEQANGGTVFLDEIGELPLDQQVKLLRVLQTGTYRRIGGETERNTDVRIIAATNRELLEEIEAKRFREDLFYRLAVAVLRLPPLSERAGDLPLLIDHFVEKIHGAHPGLAAGPEKKVLTSEAKAVLAKHSWPGNVRELENTLLRALIWSRGDTVAAEDVREAMLGPPQGKTAVLDRPLGSDLKLPDILADVARHYLGRALEEAGGNRTKAAELVGLKSYQTFDNWVERYKDKRR